MGAGRKAGSEVGKRFSYWRNLKEFPELSGTGVWLHGSWAPFQGVPAQPGASEKLKAVTLRSGVEEREALIL